MCAISGSYSLEKLKELYELNSYRGVVSSSFAIFDEESALVVLQRYTGRIPDEIWTDERMTVKDHGCYFLCHSQAPTSTEVVSTIHPAEYERILVWHNGIIKPTAIADQNEKLGTNYKWDTAILAHILATQKITQLSETLSTLNGSFACVVHAGPYSNEAGSSSLYVMRNEISPLFIDDDLNISSTKFDNSTSLPSGIMYEMDLFARRKFAIGMNFDTAENPYYIA